MTHMSNSIYDIQNYQEKKKVTSISARGVRAETESTHIRSMAPDLHIRSATEVIENQSVHQEEYFHDTYISSHRIPT